MHCTFFSFFILFPLWLPLLLLSFLPFFCSIYISILIPNFYFPWSLCPALCPYLPSPAFIVSSLLSKLPWDLYLPTNYFPTRLSTATKIIESKKRYWPASPSHPAGWGHLSEQFQRGRKAENSAFAFNITHVKHILLCEILHIEQSQCAYAAGGPRRFSAFILILGAILAF
jgi:hypothetical protein